MARAHLPKRAPQLTVTMAQRSLRNRVKVDYAKINTHGLPDDGNAADMADMVTEDLNSLEDGQLQDSPLQLMVSDEELGRDFDSVEASSLSARFGRQSRHPSEDEETDLDYEDVQEGEDLQGATGGEDPSE